MFTVALFMRGQKVETTQITINEWVDKWNVYQCNGTIFSYKKNQVLIHITTWMNLEKFMVREKRHKMLHIVRLLNRQIHRNRKYIYGCQKLRGVGNREWLLIGSTFSLWWWKYSGIRDFPGGPVGKTPRSQCRGPGFDPW